MCNLAVTQQPFTPTGVVATSLNSSIGPSLIELPTTGASSPSATIVLVTLIGTGGGGTVYAAYVALGDSTVVVNTEAASIVLGGLPRTFPIGTATHMSIIPGPGITITAVVETGY